LFGGRNTNFSFPNKRGSSRFWARVGVDSDFQEGISYRSIVHWVKLAIEYAKLIGIPEGEIIIARLGWDATDILRYLSHTYQYFFSGDHNGSAPFLQYGLKLPDTLPDPALLEELFRGVMKKLDNCKRGRCNCQGECECGQSGRCTHQQMLASLQAAATFASEQMGLVQTEKARLEEKVADKRSKYHTENKKRKYEDPTDLSTHQQSAVWNLTSKAQRLENVELSSSALSRDVAALPACDGAAPVGDPESSAAMMLICAARNVTCSVTKACRHPCTKFYSFHLQGIHAKDSISVARVRVANCLPAESLALINDKIAEMVHEASEGRVQVKMLSADGEGVAERLRCPPGKPTTLWGVATLVQGAAAQAGAKDFKDYKAMQISQGSPAEPLSMYLLHRILEAVEKGKPMAKRVAPPAISPRSDTGDNSDNDKTEVPHEIEIPYMTVEERLEAEDWLDEGDSDTYSDCQSIADDGLEPAPPLSDEGSDDEMDVCTLGEGGEADQEDQPMDLGESEPLKDFGALTQEEWIMDLNEFLHHKREEAQNTPAVPAGSAAPLPTSDFAQTAPVSADPEHRPESPAPALTAAVPVDPEHHPESPASLPTSAPAETAAAPARPQQTQEDVLLDMSNELNFQELLDTVIEKQQQPTLFQSNHGVNIASESYPDILRQFAKDMKKVDLLQELAQALFYQHLQGRVDEGDDFTKFYYVVSEGRFTHIDYQHKMKNELGKVRSQGKAKNSVALGDNSVLINWKQVHEASYTDERLNHIQSALHLAADSQNVVVAMEVFYNRDLQRALVKLGYLQTARALRVFSDAHQAWDMPGLSMEVRDQHLQRVRRLYVAMLGAGRMYSVAGEKPSHHTQCIGLWHNRKLVSGRYTVAQAMRDIDREIIPAFMLCFNGT
jgi:hypothetical protein